MSRKHRGRRKATFAAALGSTALAPVAAPVAAPDARRFHVGMISPSVVRDGRVENPDEVIKQFGSWEGLAFYARMLRQFPFLYGICAKSVAAVTAIDRDIKPGDPNNELSVQMAADARRLWSRVRGKETILQHLLWGKYYGFSAVEKVWSKDAHTQLLAPLDLYDLPQWLFKFGPNGETFVLSAKDQSQGEFVPDADARFLFFRWGSRYTPYGSGVLQYAYLPTWYIQQVLRFGLQAIERFGRPIPWVRYWRGIDPDDKNDIEKSLAAQFKNYVMTPQDTNLTELEFPAQSVTAAGAAGRAEIEFIRFMQGWAVNAMNLAPMAQQDRSGGAYAAEQVRENIAQDQTPPASQALDATLTEGWLDPVSEQNWRTQPRALWPYFDSDTSEVAQMGLNGAQVSAVVVIGEKLSTNTITATYAEEALAATGIPRVRAAKMVASMVAERDTLAKPVVPVAAPSPLMPIEEHDSEDSDAA